MVEERSNVAEAGRATDGGSDRSEYPDISTDKYGENPYRRKDKVSWARVVLPGLVES